MAEVNMRRRILTVGESSGRTGKHGVQEKRVRCQGCGEWIRSDGDLTDVEYVKTKRGSEWFFHTACLGQIWQRKIC